MRQRRSVASMLRLGALTLAFGVGGAAELAAQVPTGWRDLTLTGGVSVEGYQGNLAALTVPLVDSTEQAAAAAGEFAGRAEYVFLENARRFFGATMDAGMRQFAATGFEVRDYAPREWVGSIDLTYQQNFTWGSLHGTGRVRGRSVSDRPPIPLYIQPAYGAGLIMVGARFAEIERVRFDIEVTSEVTDYRSNDFAPLLDLLDRTSTGFEVGAGWGDAWRVRFFSGYQSSRYEGQPTYDDTDPSRRDRTLRLGSEWEAQGDVWAQLGVEGTFNRSNSNRPEYDALSVKGLVSVPLPWELSANAYGVLTAKRYLTDLQFARLVPGEEADNASVLYLSLLRPLAPNLDGSVRLGWTRAETEVGGSYFRRYGLGFFLHYRP